MKQFIFTLSMLIFSITTFSQSFTQTFRGTVFDEITGNTIIGATVVLTDSNNLVGTITDADGNFIIRQIPVGRRSFEISCMGYQTSKLNNILITTGKEMVVEIRLKEKITQLKEFQIKSTEGKEKPLNKMAMVSARSFSIEETERFAGSLGDPARMAANFAGVMTQNDSRNDIIIRGNSPIGVLWRLDGIEIPNPNHFAANGTTGGPVSMLNNNLLRNSDFFTGAFPAEFGNALSGVFDLKMRNGNNQNHEFIGQIGFNGFEMGAEGPLFSIGDRMASYIANFRYSTLDVMSKLGIDFGTGAAIPKYKDLTFNINIPTVKAGNFKIIGLWGNSFIEMGRTFEDTTNTSYNRKNAATDFGSGLGVAALTHDISLNENMRIKSTISMQYTDATTAVDSVDLVAKSYLQFYRSKNYESKQSFNSQFTHRINQRNNYTLGVSFDSYQIQFNDSINSRKYGRYISNFDVDNSLSIARGYGQWQHKFNNSLAINGGLNFQHTPLTNENSIEPRGAIKWMVDSKNELSVGYGRHSQLQPHQTYFYHSYNSLSNSYYYTNSSVKSTKADHYVLSYDWFPVKGFRIKTETYYQRLFKVPVSPLEPTYSMLNSGDFFYMPQVDSLQNSGSGYNYGIELTIEKFLDNGYYFLFTTSIFDSKYKGYDGVLRNTAYNGNYVFNLLGGYEVKLNNKYTMTFDAKTVYAGGRRYVPVDFVASQNKKEEILDYNKSFEKRYNDYFRTDLRIGLKQSHKKFTQEWAIDLQNVTNYNSIFMQTYDVSTNTLDNTYQQGFMPMFLYRINF